MNAKLARSIEIIEFAASHFADSASGLMPWARDEGEARAVARLEGAAELLDAAAAELKKAREGR